MGNRAVITTKEKDLALYLHWNGGRDAVEPLLKYCELQGYRPPSKDCFGWARLAQVMGNFFGGSSSVGIDKFDNFGDRGDNGIYIIDGWKIVGREGLYEGFVEQQEYNFDEMLKAFDNNMPDECKLGSYLDAQEIPVSEVQLGDVVYMRGYGRGYKKHAVVGFGVECERHGARYVGIPYVDKYDHDGDFSWNRNNYLTSDTVRIVPRDEVTKDIEHELIGGLFESCM